MVIDKRKDVLVTSHFAPCIPGTEERPGFPACADGRTEHPAGLGDSCSWDGMGVVGWE